jgi:hypothetical protein
VTRGIPALVVNTLVFAAVFVLVFRAGIVTYMVAVVVSGVAAALWTRRVFLVVGPAAIVGVLAFAVVMWAQAAADNQPVYTPMSDGFVALLQWPDGAIAGGMALVNGSLALVGWIGGTVLRGWLFAERRHGATPLKKGAVEQ